MSKIDSEIQQAVLDELCWDTRVRATEVTNQIDVQAPAVFPREVERAIEDALARRAERTAHHVSVGVQHDTVTLRGVVRSVAERDLVLGAVTGTRGVKHIDNQLRVERRAS